MRRAFPLLAGAALAVGLAFLVLPVVAIFVQAPPGDLLAALATPGALDALAVSLRATGLALVVIVLLGTPAAWLLATRRFRGRAAVLTAIELPLVLPPAVAGLGLLAALGPRGLLGGPAPPLALQFAGVVVALVFVSAPFYVRGAVAAFEGVERSWLEASRTLGASEARTFAAVAVPAAMPGLAAGLALSWGRALGEFGATLMFAGSLPGVTQTAALAVYDRFATDLTAALALSAVLVCFAAGILLTVKLLVRG